MAHVPDRGRSGPRRADRGSDRLARWILAVALLIGFARLLGLSRWSLWLDEAYTLADARHATSFANPLGYALFGAFYDLFEGRPDEFVLRFPGAVFGWLTIGLTGLVFRPFVGARCAALAALLLAISPWHLYWSQNARFYTLAQFLGLGGGALVYHGLERARALTLFLGLVTLGSSALAHPSAVALLGAFLIVPWFARKRGLLQTPAQVRSARPVWWMLGGALVLAALFASVWLVDVWATWERRQGQGDPIHFVLTTGYLMTPWIGGAAIVGAALSLRQRSRGALFLLLIVAAGMLAALCASFFVRVSAQYVFVFLPWCTALAAYPFRARRLAAFALLCVPLLVESVLYFAVRHGDRPRWRDAYRFVFDRKEAGDLVLGMDAPVAEYYWSPRNTDLRHWREVVLMDSFRARVAEEWLRWERRMWLVVNLEELQDWEAADRRDMRAFLEQECRLEAHFEVPLTPRDLDVRVYLYDPVLRSGRPGADEPISGPGPGR